MARGTELHMYDFDGTLFRAPNKPSWWGRKSWVLNYASLSPPCVPLTPGPEWWIEDTVRSARESIESPRTWAILCTARYDKVALRFRIAELVKNKGLDFDEIYLSHVKDVADKEERSRKQARYKLNVMLRLLRRHSHIETVQIWEDHDEHLPWFVKRIEATGTCCIPHLIVATSHKPLCTDPFEAKDNPLGMRTPKGVVPVRVGEYGKLVHCYHRSLGGILCKSGADVAVFPQKLYDSKAKFVTCYRCDKLMTMNLEAGRRAWKKG